MLYKVARAVTGSDALAEEVVQDALFQAWSSMPSWDGDVPIRWMRRVTRNRAISVMRHESRSVTGVDLEDRGLGGPEIERVVEGRLRILAVERALGELDEQSRTMIVLRETEAMSYEDIGELVGLTTSAVKAKLYRARHALKGRLRDWDQ